MFVPGKEKRKARLRGDECTAVSFLHGANLGKADLRGLGRDTITVA